MYNYAISVPDQFVSDSKKKNEKWKEDCINAYESLILHESKTLRTSYYNKVTNYNLKRGILNMNDVEKVIDPYGLGMGTFPAKMEHKGIGNSKIDLLVGEHSRRKFDWRVVRSSYDQSGLKEVEMQKTAKVSEFFLNALFDEEMDEATLEKELKKLSRFINSPFFDLAESGSNKVLEYYYNKCKLQYIFNDTFEDALISGEQIAFIEDISGELVVRRGDPTRVFMLMDAYSTTEDGLEALVEVSYATVSSVIEKFHKHLTKAQVKKLKEGSGNMGGSEYPYVTYPRYGDIGELAIPSDSVTAQMQQLLPFDQDGIGGNLFSATYDGRGNIRVLYCIWRSKRLIKYIKYYDEMGVEQLRPAHQSYEPDIELGETVDSEEWINEWWRGYKIGDMVVGCEPVPYLSNNIDNIARQTPPVVIQFYNSGSSRSQSLMDIVKPFDYLYNVFDFKRQILVNLMLPDILTFPVTMKPETMTLHEYINYIVSTGFMPQDPTANVMTPRGLQSAGQFNTVTGNRLSSTQQGPLQTLTVVMDSVIRTMDIVSGITQQRQGAIDSRELVGNVERSVSQSALSTERWFSRNDWFKERVMQRILDISLNRFREKPEQLAYIVNDFTKAVLTESEIEAIQTADLDLHVNSSTDNAIVMQSIEKLFEMGVNNGTTSIGDIIEVYKNRSISEAASLIRAKEEEMREQQAQAQEQEQQIQLQIQEMASQEAEANRQLKIYEIDQNNQTKIRVAAINAYRFTNDLDQDNSGIPDPIEMERAYNEQYIADAEISLKERELQSKEQIEQQKLADADKERQHREKLEKMKAENKIAVEKLKLKNPVVGEKKPANVKK